jgi:hypothetical protein
MTSVWRAGLRISEALALAETDLDARRGSIVVQNGRLGLGTDHAVARVHRPGCAVGLRHTNFDTDMRWIWLARACRQRRKSLTEPWRAGLRQDARVTSKGVIRQRRRVAAAVAGSVLVMGVLLLALGGGDDPKDGAAAKKPPAPPQLPGGGRTIFPGHMVVAYYGAPQAKELGELGIGPPAKAGARLLDQAKEYETVNGQKILPAMELIVEIAHREPGSENLYRGVQPDSVIRRYLRAARKIGAILILDIQPGHASFFADSQALEKWLVEPDVSLALDPEWATPGAIPGTVIGSVDVREVNAVSFWLDQLTTKHDLPQKLLVVHRFTENMIIGEDQLKPRSHVAVTVNVDGFGGREIKISKYKAFAQRAAGLHNGFKLFYHEDLDLLKPERVLRMKPPPELVVYE